MSREIGRSIIIQQHLVPQIPEMSEQERCQLARLFNLRPNADTREIGYLMHYGLTREDRIALMWDDLRQNLFGDHLPRYPLAYPVNSRP